MSDYTKATDFAAKDALLTGVAAKIVSGTEIDDEFNLISSAVATKVESNAGTHTGTTTMAVITGASSITSTAFVGNVTGNVTGDVTGNLTGNVTGDVTGDVTGSATTAATVTTAAQPAITSVGTLTSLAVSGTVDGRDVAVDGAKLDLVGSHSVKLNSKVVNIGVWNMDSTPAVWVYVGVAPLKVRSISVIVMHDNEDIAYNFNAEWWNYAAQTGAKTVAVNSSQQLNLNRLTAGHFDGLGFDSTSINRGFITIQYVD